MFRLKVVVVVVMCCSLLFGKINSEKIVEAVVAV